MSTQTVIIVGVMASSVVIAGGLAKLAGSIMKLVFSLRDNQALTGANTRAIADIGQKMDARMIVMEDWMRNHERNHP